MSIFVIFSPFLSLSYCGEILQYTSINIPFGYVYRIELPVQAYAFQIYKDTMELSSMVVAIMYLQ